MTATAWRRVHARTQSRRSACGTPARRLLPIAGEVLVKVGDRVEARQVVAQTFMPGDITPLNMAKLLSMPPADVPECMLKKEGDRIEAGEALARTKGIFGKFRTEYKSEVAGTIESISAVTGQVIVRGAPLPVAGEGVSGGHGRRGHAARGLRRSKPTSRSSRASSASAARRSGRSAWSCKRHDQELTEDLITPDMKGCVVVGGARVTAQAIERARKVGVSADHRRRHRRRRSRGRSRLQPRRGDHRLRTHRPDARHHRRVRRDRDGRAHVRSAGVARGRRGGGERRDADPRRRHAAGDRHSAESRPARWRCRDGGQWGGWRSARRCGSSAIRISG